MNKYTGIVKLYAVNVYENKMNISDVPEVIRTKVKECLNELMKRDIPKSDF